MSHVCTVCGYPDLEHPPRGAEGGGSFEICPCCGFQFGVDDDDRGIQARQWRERWIAGGMIWWSRGRRAPSGWNPQAQLVALQNRAEAHGPARSTPRPPPKDPPRS